MSETEKQRKEIIEELQKETNKSLIEILYVINNLDYRDKVFENKIDIHIPWLIDEVTRLVDRARRDLDKINGYDGGSYPWA